MVRETSAAPAIKPGARSPVSLPELGIALHRGRAYRVRILPVSQGASRLWTVHARPLAREGSLVKLQLVRRLGHQTGRPPGVLSIAAGRIASAELLDPGDGGKLTLSEGTPKPNGRVKRGVRPLEAVPARDITRGPGTGGRETEHRSGSLADGPAGVAVTVAGRAVNVTHLEHSEDRRYGDPAAIARRIVAHRAECMEPGACELSRGMWAELVAAYGPPVALGAFYAAERELSRRRSAVTARAMLAIAPQTVAARP